MTTLHTVVLTKGVPDFREGQVSFDEEGHLERGKTPTVMNPNDRAALRAALQVTVRNGGPVSLMSMGPPGYEEVLREGMRDVYADDCYLLSDREMGAADTWATAMTVATGIQQLAEPPDIVMAGFKTADGETGHTGPQTAYCLGWPLVTHVTTIDVDAAAGRLRAERLVDGDASEVETVEAPLPCFLVADPAFEPTYRTASHRLEHKDRRAATQHRAEDLEDHLTVWDHEDLNLDPDYIGLDGSPTIVAGVDPILKAPAERDATVVDGGSPGELEPVLEELTPFAAGD